MPLRLIFMGTPEFAVPALLAIVGSGHEIVAVYSRAPKRAGRGMELRPAPVAREAERFGLPIFTPATLRTAEAAATFAGHGADLAVVVAYGLILPRSILDAVPLGCFNLHASLLPRWRGAAPINRAIMAGDAVTGVMVMKMDEGLDTGPIAMAERMPIGQDMIAGELHDALARLGADLIVRALGGLERGALQLVPQASSGVTLAAKLDNRETRIDWARPWKEVHDHCRGLSPFPGAWFEVAQGDGTPVRIRVLRTTQGDGSGPAGHVLDRQFTVACQEGSVRLVEVQRDGRRSMSGEEFLRGATIGPGTPLF